MSKISVVIPTYNQAKYLKKCIEIVLLQTRKPDEVIVVDDHSTDQTPKIAALFKNRIKYIRHEENLGSVKTFNDGLKRTKGNYILMVSGDDRLEKNILEKEADILNKYPQIGLVYAQSYQLENGRRKLIVHPKAGKKNYLGREKEFENLLLSGDYIPYMTAMVRKKVYQKLGYWDEKLPYLHDFEFFVRAAQKFKFAYIAKPLATYRIHARNLHKSTNRLRLWETEFEYIIQKYLKEDSDLKKEVYVNLHLNLSVTEAQLGNYKRGLILFLKALKTKPNLLTKTKTYKSILSIFMIIFKKNTRVKKTQNEIRLVLGCGPLPIHKMHYRWIDDSWILTDLYPQDKKILKMDARNIPYPENGVDELYASHLLEHISHTETLKTLKEWHRVLKPGGVLTINVPDIEWACEKFLANYQKKQPTGSSAYESYKDLLLVFYGHQYDEGEYHKTGFTQKSLEQFLQQAGFKKIILQKTFDDHLIGVLIAQAVK